MAEKKFAGVNGPVESGAVSADFETAQRFGELKVGRLGVYSRDGFRTRFLAYEETERAFVRVQEVRGRMCCAQAFFAYFRMIHVCGGREVYSSFQRPLPAYSAPKKISAPSRK